MTVRLRCCDLHYKQVRSPWQDDEHVSVRMPWMDTAWQLTFEIPQETPPIHETNDGPWDYHDGSIWRDGPRRMTPLLCYEELIAFLRANHFGMLAGHINDEMLNRALGVVKGENGETDLFGPTGGSRRIVGGWL